MKKMICLVLALIMLLPSAAYAANDTADPDATVTRGEVVQTLYEREGQPMVIQSVAFEDAAGTRYANAAAWAKGAGIVNGNEKGMFDGERDATRAELAAMLFRYARYSGMDVSAAQDTNILSYNDAFTTPSWAMEGFQFACAYDVLAEKNEEGRVLLAAGDRITSAELARSLERLDALRAGEDAYNALAAVKARGVLRVGATGDYRPMSFLDAESGTYWGFDAELAEDLAAALNVKLEYVPTTWPTLMADTLAGQFDLAICGITITDARKEQALMSDGYLGNGKTVLCRAEDAGKYTSLAAINRPEVTVMENPGGLNEKFARENLPEATLVIHNVNEEIPGLVASGEADVMITEILEAGWYVGQDGRLAAPLIYAPFTQGQLGILMPKGSETLLDYVNAFLAEEKASGRIDALAEEYIYRFIDHNAAA